MPGSTPGCYGDCYRKKPRGPIARATVLKMAQTMCQSALCLSLVPPADFNSDTRVSCFVIRYRTVCRGQAARFDWR
jgi:hypothetical protein